MTLSILALAALVPLLTGFIWYNPKVFGNAWMKAADVSPEKMKGANMALIFGLTYLFSFFLAAGLYSVVIHQAAIHSILANEPSLNVAGSPLNLYVADFMSKYGHNFRTFKHGAFHGGLAGIMLALPLIGVNALFERRGFNYIMINWGFWWLNLILMGGIICQFA